MSLFSQNTDIVYISEVVLVKGGPHGNQFANNGWELVSLFYNTKFEFKNKHHMQHYAMQNRVANRLKKYIYIYSISISLIHTKATPMYLHLTHQTTNPG